MEQSNLVISNLIGLVKNFEISEISRVIYTKSIKYQWLGLASHFDISIIFEISVFGIQKLKLYKLF